MTFDKKARRFRDAKGRFVTKQSVRDVVMKAGDVFRRKAKGFAEDLNEGRISHGEWKRKMSGLVKDNLIFSASIGRGGRKQMTKSDWGKVGSDIKREYRYLNKFAKATERLSPLQIAARARQYAHAGFIAFSRTLAQTETAYNRATEAIRYRHASESCSGCRSYSGRWMPVAEMPEIGSLQCGHRCRCHIEYR